jgi:hypothetical protein
MLSNILLSRLSTYMDDIFGDHPCWFYIRQKIEKNWNMEYTETVPQLFMHFKKGRNIVQYSHRAWNTHEISPAD